MPVALTPCALDVIEDFRKIDLNKNGEITLLEFTDALRSNPATASKFGLSDDILSSNGTREKYGEIFSKMDESKIETVNVINNSNLFPVPTCDV
jgi:hypothetical protein